MKCVPQDVKNRIVLLSNEGKSVADISRATGVAWSTCKGILWKYWKTGCTSNNWNNSKRVKWTEKHVKTLSRMIKANPDASSGLLLRQFWKEYPDFSRATFYRRLKVLNHLRSDLVKNVIIPAPNRMKRKKWAKSRLKWKTLDWHGHIFSGEIWVQVFGSKKVRFWSKADEKYRPDIVPFNPHPNAIQLELWASITSCGKGIFLPNYNSATPREYCQILQDGLLPVIDRYYPEKDCIFVHDKTLPHTSRQTQQWLDHNQVRVSTCPIQSSDLNIINTVWKIMKPELQKVSATIHSQQELVNVVQQIWREIGDGKIVQLYQNLPKRVRAVVKSKGGITQYYL